MSKKKKRKTKRRKGQGKGGQFERTICKQLSWWWTEGKRDDVFWRTSGSGARATSRSKRGASTFGQYGDIQATDPDGQPLLDLCTIEIKKGYSQQTIFDLVDKLPGETKQPYKKFISQAREENAAGNARFWILITKRDRKETLIIMPSALYKIINTMSYLNQVYPSFMMKLRIDNKAANIYGTTLDEFFRCVDPQMIRDL